MRRPRPQVARRWDLTVTQMGRELAEKRRTVSGLIRNFSLDEFRQQRQRFLPAEITSFGRNGCRYPFLRDVQLGSAKYLLQADRRSHFSGQVRVVELVRVADKLVRRQFELSS